MADSKKDIRKRVHQAQLHYADNISIIEEMLLHERGYVSRQPVGEDVVVLLSGGLDSSVLVDKIIRDWDVIVHPLFFKRGSRNEKYEEEAFNFFIDFYKHRFPKNIGHAYKLGVDVPHKEFKADLPKAMAQTIGHPLRNSTLQNIAVGYSYFLAGKFGLEAKTILSGSVAEDNTEPETGLLSLRAQTLNTCIQLADWSWQITSPFTDLQLVEHPIRKIDLILYARKMKIPLEKTRTCFGNEELADGTCFACKKRIGAFKYLNMKDPIKYQK